MKRALERGEFRPSRRFEGEFGGGVNGLAAAVHQQECPVVRTGGQDLVEFAAHPCGQFQLRDVAHDVGYMRDLRGLRLNNVHDVGVIMPAGMDGDASREVNQFGLAIRDYGSSLRAESDLIRFKADDFGQ